MFISKRSSGTSADLEQLINSVSSNLMDTSSLLRDIVARLVIDRIPITCDGEIDLKKYKAVDLPKRKIYRITGEGMESSSFEYDIYGLLSVELTKDNPRIFYTENPSGKQPPIVVTLGYQRYVYPPRDYVSYLFFKLNPDMEKKAREIFEKLPVPNEYKAYLSDLLMVEKKVSSITPPDEILTDDHHLTYRIETYGSICFSREVLERFKHIESFFYGDKAEDAYHVVLRYDGEEATYSLIYGNIFFSLAMLLKNNLDPRDLELIGKTTQKIERAAKKSYIVLTILSKINSS